ncbi:MAG: hypothetical protein M3525_12710 [Acidobacteriota bacterium]|nr:hypothetical protein [Acidobacteriota bacterium]
MKRLCCVLIMIFSVFTVETFSKEWNGITPCVTTRFKAEKLLGKDDLPKSEIAIYKYKKSRVSIDYDRKDDNDFNKDVVRKIRVRPDKIITLAKYTKKIPNFQKDYLKTKVDDKISHLTGLAVYRNWTEGFEIWVQKEQDTGD